MNRCQCGRLISHHKHMCLACMWHEAKRRAETMKIKPKEIKVCKKCGKEFFPKNSTREIYCSDKCRKQATYQMQKARRKWGICMICGAEFEYSAINRRKRCDECTEADIRKPYKLAEKKRTTPDEKRSSAAEKAARLARLPEGADPRDAWMRDVGAIPIKTETARGKAKAFIRINPAKLPAPPREPTRRWKGKTAEERFLESVAKAKAEYRMKAPAERKRRDTCPKGRYTETEDAIILNMRKSGVKIAQIAEATGRSVPAIKQRLGWLAKNATSSSAASSGEEYARSTGA